MSVVLQLDDFGAFVRPQSRPPTTRTERKKYQLAVACMFKDSLIYLRESIPFHIMVGVEHFYLCDNGSTENYMPFLQPYIDAGRVELTHRLNAPGPWESNTHIKFMDDVINATKNDVEWLALLDADEFLVPVKSNNIAHVLNQAKFAAHGGVSINWFCYGCNGIERLSPVDLLLERMNRRAPDTQAVNRHLKVIVRPARTQRWAVHHANYESGYGATNTALVDTTNSLFADVCGDEIRLNHYYIGDAAHWKMYKYPFLKDVYGVASVAEIRKQNVLTESNDVEDNIAHRWVPVLRRVLYPPPPFSLLSAIEQGQITLE